MPAILRLTLLLFMLTCSIVLLSKVGEQAKHTSVEAYMQFLTAPKAVLREGKQLFQDAKQIPRMVTDPKLARTYYPTERRKTKLRILIELLVWLLRYRDVNSYYYVYGFDRLHGVNMDEYLSYRSFRNIRNQRNLHPRGAAGYNYVCIMRDKFVFSQFVSSLGFPAIKNLAICNKESITWLDQMRTVPLETLLQQQDLYFDGFCKRLAGILGKGAFPLRLTDSQLLINDQPITLDELKARLDGQYLLQERVQQHPKMSSLHPASINTVRLITFNNNGTVAPFAAAIRIGTHGKNVDNWAAGGIVVGIDLATGQLREEGFFKPGYGGRVTKHPDTDVEFFQFEIPHFQEAVKLATQLHKYLYGIHSIGWDIAITETGPIFIEGNDDWEGGIPMVLERSFKQRFLAMYRA